MKVIDALTGNNFVNVVEKPMKFIQA